MKFLKTSWSWFGLYDLPKASRIPWVVDKITKLASKSAAQQCKSVSVIGLGFGSFISSCVI